MPLRFNSFWVFCSGSLPVTRTFYSDVWLLFFPFVTVNGGWCLIYILVLLICKYDVYKTGIALNGFARDIPQRKCIWNYMNWTVLCKYSSDLWWKCAVEACQERSSSNDIHPFLKRLYHLSVCIWPRAFSPNAIRILCISEAVCLSLKKNLMHICCSFTSVSLPGQYDRRATLTWRHKKCTEKTHTSSKQYTAWQSG
jgi:hypothetical protein